ncbi:MAG: radical SAM protein [Planctomycetota bacterium]|jgi:MoaA/NifB/PqqE/SkfB family radical SAM enzyme
MEEFSPFHPLKILSYFHEIQEILGGKIPTPRMIEIFPTAVCEHECLGCHSRGLRDRFPAAVDVEAFLRLIEEVAACGIQAVELGGGGEPLLHPQVEALLDGLAGRNLAVGITTNGLPIGEKKLGARLVSACTYVRVGIDAGCAETYAKVHGVDGFEALLDIVAGLVEAKKREGGKCTLGVKFLASRANTGEIPRAVEIARSLGVDYIQFKPLRWSEEWELPEGEKKSLSGEIRRLREANPGPPIIVGTLEPREYKGHCYLSPLMPVVSSGGDLFACPFFQHRMDALRIGNLFETPFREIWGGSRHREVIQSLRMEDCAQFDCPLMGAMKVADQAILEDRMHTRFL